MAQVFYVNLLKKPLIFFISSLQSLLFLENHCFRVLSTRFAEVRIEEYLLQKTILHLNLPEWSPCNAMLPKTQSVPKKNQPHEWIKEEAG